MSETNVKIEKIQKTSKIVLILASIAKVLCIVVAVSCLVGGMLSFGLKDAINSGIIRDLDNGTLQMEDVFAGQKMKADVCEAIVQNGHTAEVLAGYLLTCGVMTTVMAVMFHFIGRIFKDFREGYSPFQPALVKKLKVLFVFITLFTLKTSLLIGALIGLALWCVLQIFDYGCVLQRESDETL